MKETATNKIEEGNACVYHDYRKSGSIPHFYILDGETKKEISSLNVNRNLHAIFDKNTSFLKCHAKEKESRVLKIYGNWKGVDNTSFKVVKVSNNDEYLSEEELHTFCDNAQLSTV